MNYVTCFNAPLLFSRIIVEDVTRCAGADFSAYLFQSLSLSLRNSLHPLTFCALTVNGCYEQYDAAYKLQQTVGCIPASDREM